MLNGLAMTKLQQNGCGKGHTHVLARACLAYNTFTENMRKERGFSEWFIPSVGQWKLALEGMGLTPWDNMSAFTGVHNSNEILKAVFDRAGLSSFWATNSNYVSASSSPIDKDHVYKLSFSFTANNGVPMKCEKKENFHAFPFMAF